jgi:hypothetical protein
MDTPDYDDADEQCYVDCVSEDDISDADMSESDLTDTLAKCYQMKYFNSYCDNDFIFSVTLPYYFAKKYNDIGIVNGDNILSRMADLVCNKYKNRCMRLHYDYTLTIKELQKYNTYVNEKIKKYRNNLINIFPNDITNIIIDYIK